MDGSVLPESETEIYVEAFVYFPVEEVDAPLIVGAVVSTTNEDETSILYQAYARAFGFHPAPLKEQVKLYVPSDKFDSV